MKKFKVLIAAALLSTTSGRRAAAGYCESASPMRYLVRDAGLIAVGQVEEVTAFEYPSFNGLGRPQISKGYIFTLRVERVLKGDPEVRTVRFCDRYEAYKQDARIIVFLKAGTGTRIRIPEEVRRTVGWRYVTSGSRFTTKGTELDALVEYTARMCERQADAGDIHAELPVPKLVLSIARVKAVPEENDRFTLIVTLRFTNKSAETIAIHDSQFIVLTLLHNVKHRTWLPTTAATPPAASFSLLRPGQSLDRKMRFSGLRFEKESFRIEATYQFGIYPDNCGLVLTEPNPWCGLVRSGAVDTSKQVREAVR